MKPNSDISNKQMFRTHTTVSPEEILAAGGATAYGIKTGKNSDELKKALRNSPKPEPFTEEEWDSLIAQLENDK
jgi:hypothetical protein